MKFVFWQGIISIHQKDFLESLAVSTGVGGVTLVVENTISGYRTQMGWKVPEIKHVNLIISPTPDLIASLIRDKKEAIHIFGGLRVGQMLTTAFDLAIKSKVKIGVMTEPFDRTGIKGKIRFLKYFAYKLKYFGKIDFVLAIGKAGVKAYSDLGYPDARLFPWAYFINVPDKYLEEKPGEGVAPLRLLFAGRLDANKAIARFVGELVQFKSKNFVFDIYGTGEEEEKIRKSAKDNGLADRIRIYPFMEHDAFLEKYQEYDWVVLVSQFKDGWGAIVGEGLQNGLNAICSKVCGASWAVNEGFNGITFDWNKPGDCHAAIEKMLNNGGNEDQKLRSDWAKGALSGAAGANYLLRIMGCVYAGKEKPAIPWTR